MTSMGDESESEFQLDSELAEATGGDEDGAGWESLLTFLQASRGFEFRGYKPTGLRRRIRKRMQALGIGDFAEYEEHLELNPDEFGPLFNTILINVTSFFRDPAAWQALREGPIRDMLNRKREDEHVRVWSAGCATGQEAYTAAMVFAEEIGVQAFRERVKIYATDIDENALTVARHATYSAREVEGVPPDLLSRYFERSDSSFGFRKDMRRQIIFGRHDVMQDPPISRIDLLLCRNTLMYFSAETQANILARFHFALAEGGVLFLGRAETLMNQARAFAPIDIKHRITRKTGALFVPRRTAPSVPMDDDRDERDVESRLARAALKSLPAAQIVLDPEGTVVMITERAREMFGLSGADVRRPLRDLRISYRPVELRSLIDETSLERRPALVRDVEWRLDSGDLRWLDVQVHPLIDAEGTSIGTSITFVDVTATKRVQEELHHVTQERETAYEELQSTNEELETTNEELQSTIEELETTNEEMQSANEELETMNEELRSTNDQLQGINETLRERSDQLNHANAFLQTVLSGLGGAVIVVDGDMRVIEWNETASEIWGLRSEEVRGKSLLGLDFGLDVLKIRRTIEDCVRGRETRRALSVSSMNRRGRSFTCRVTCGPLRNPAGQTAGAIIIAEEQADD